MARLTEREVELIQRAKIAARGQGTVTEQLLAEAHRLRALAVGRSPSRAFGRLARASGVPALGRFLEREIAVPLRRGIKRRRLVSELGQLDRHLLRDIGLERNEIARFAATLSQEAVPMPAAAEGLGVTFQRWLGRWRTRRALEALDNRMLADIGVARHQIPSVARRLLAPLVSTPPGAEAIPPRGRPLDRAA